MKKKIFSLFLLFVMFCSISASAFAVENTKSLQITFLANGQMDNGGVNSNTIQESVAGMQPGDTTTFEITILNANANATRWYMWNRVLDSLEQSARAGLAQGGAYSYILRYDGPTLHQEIFNSDKLGGTEEEGAASWRTGLQQATADLEEYFFLDTLNSGERGKVTLTVYLEGETQGNDYQNTVADLQMRFGVETIGNNQRSAVKTGDENNLTPYYIAMVVVGLLFLYLALDAITDRMYKKGRD